MENRLEHAVEADFSVLKQRKAKTRSCFGWCLGPRNWVGGEIVQAMAYDNPIPGFDTYNTNNLRLWRACPSKA